MILLHPRVLSPMDVIMAGLTNDKANCSVESRFESMTYHVHEMDECYQLVLDVPGVKKSDVTVQLLSGSVLHVTADRHFPKSFNNQKQEATRKYKQSFAVDPKVVDTSRITADLEDGLLVLKVMKKAPEKPVDIPVLVSSPPNTENNDSDFLTLVTIDLPGVKSTDLKLQFVDDKINIDAERMRGTNSVKVQKSVMVNTRNNVKLTDFQAYLLDGVLTITARKFRKDDSKAIESTSSDDAVVTIPISSPTTNISKVETVDKKILKSAEHSDNEDVVVIETVDAKESD